MRPGVTVQCTGYAIYLQTGKLEYTVTDLNQLILMTLFLIILTVAAIAVFFAARRAAFARREKYIAGYYFHKGIVGKLAQKHPQLKEQEVELVMQTLRDYFLMCLRAKRRLVSMPSQVVDDAWHEFILSTRIYGDFCRRAFGYFLHHTPAEAMATPTQAKEGIKRAWRLACIHEKIDPKTPAKLPLIFAIDGLLNIPGGFTYRLHCDRDTRGIGSGVYCASHIGCSSGCAGDSGAVSDSPGCSGDGGCGGGCGGGD
jgi:hypothetical protein